MKNLAKILAFLYTQNIAELFCVKTAFHTIKQWQGGWRARAAMLTTACHIVWYSYRIANQYAYHANQHTAFCDQGGWLCLHQHWLNPYLFVG